MTIRMNRSLLPSSDQHETWQLRSLVVADHLPTMYRLFTILDLLDLLFKSIRGHPRIHRFVGFVFIYHFNWPLSEPYWLLAQNSCNASFEQWKRSRSSRTEFNGSLKFSPNMGLRKEKSSRQKSYLLEICEMEHWWKELINPLFQLWYWKKIDFFYCWPSPVISISVFSVGHTLSPGR